MLRRSMALVFVTSLMAFFASNFAQASVIGVGLDWRSGVFVQEVWHKGAPHYLLANLSKEAVEITAHEFDEKWRLGQPLPKAEAGPWKVAAGGHAIVDAKAVAGDRLRRFVIGGKRPLGVLPGVSDPGYKGEGYATRAGLNGSGGVVPGVFLEQSSLEFVPGSTVKFVLHIPAKSGVLKFNLAPEKNDDPLRPVTLVVGSATSETLPVTSDDKQITINSDAPTKDAVTHQVTLSVTIPAGKSPRLQMLDGWLARGSGGNGITRGVWIATPKK